MELRTKTRHIECKNIIEKIIHNVKGKKKISKHIIRIEENRQACCHLITDLLNEDEYSEDELLKMYRVPMGHRSILQVH